MADDRLQSLGMIVAVVTLPLGILAVLFVGAKVGASVFIVGWLLLVPLLFIIDEELLPTVAAHDTQPDRTDSLSVLKERYARGELDDEAFERRVETLLETEDSERNHDTHSNSREREFACDR
ncbi:SHOCT domain-containing protein [Halocatena marina]|uniref:SHOCT domain-containing protein n=1 Tax=Halocatena marina TaxID=2934937 RepID=A0ABD5YSG1_9EURY|nr:SHOCT domain-containing protein [Halocatena marina]